MNLFFVSQLQNKGYDISFIKEKVYVKQPSWKKKAQIGIKSNMLYFTDFCDKEGIRREWTTPYNSEQNGLEERKNKTIVEATRVMLYDQDMPIFLWTEAYNTTIYVQNMTPHRALGKITPEKVFTRKTPEVNHFRIFGSLAYSHIPEEKRKKLDQTAEK